MKQWFLIMIIFCSGYYAKAQQHPDSMQSVIDVVNQLNNVYANSTNLSFHVFYTYAAESKPNTILDSIPALIQISNNRFHTIIGPTETIANNQYAVILFSEDKIMYITKPTTVQNVDPMAKIDSSLLSLKGLQTLITDGKKIKTLEIDFPDGSFYKSIKLSVDKKSGFLMNAMFVVKASSLPDDAMQNIKKTNIDNGYALIKASYSDYSDTMINDSVFDPARYFIRDNKNFNTTKEYKEYKIFIGSPNL